MAKNRPFIWRAKKFEEILNLGVDFLPKIALLGEGINFYKTSIFLIFVSLDK